MSNKCRDCGANEGEYHSVNCDMERCPFCGGQLISCGCCYELLKIDVSEGTWAYSHGLTDEQAEQFEHLLDVKGKIPWVQIPVLCELCGEVFPDFFHVPNEEWQKYVIPPLQHTVLCRICYNKQVALFPNGWQNAKERHD
jgi:hypothetical protein